MAKPISAAMNVRFVQLALIHLNLNVQTAAVYWSSDQSQSKHRHLFNPEVTMIDRSKPFPGLCKRIFSPRIIERTCVALITIVAVLLVGCTTSRQAKSTTPAAPETPTMSQYFVALLYSGPSRDSEEAEVQRIQAAHISRIKELIASGEMVVAGPFDGGDLRGMFIYDVESMEEAEALADSDPAIKAGRLRAEIHAWWGPTSLREMKDTP